MPEKLMIDITEPAATHIKKQLENLFGKLPTEKKQSVGFRLTTKAAGCSGFKYVPALVEKSQTGDTQLEIKQINVYIDSRHISALNGIVVDFVKKDLGMGQLAFLNPNAKSTCGCGESFTMADGNK